MTALIVDGTNVAHRALAAPSDDPPSAVFFRIVESVARHHSVSEVTMCWDTPGLTWRHRLHPGYKNGAQVGIRPVDFLIRDLREAVAQRGWQSLQAPGYEADDLVARAVHSSRSSLVLSSDRDVWQLVSDTCRVVAHRDGERITIDADWVEAETGVPPRQYVDVAALRGDESDGLPNVPGIGPARAAALVRRFASVEGIYAHLDKLPPQRAYALDTHREQVALNLVLTRLDPPSEALLRAS